MSSSVKRRDSNIDLLRLVCMMMVVSMHYFGWGGINDSPDTTKINFILASGIGVLCRVAVNCFYMITGYYIKTDESEISERKILWSLEKHYKKIWLYSVTVYIVCCLFGLVTFSGKELLESCLPIMSNQWWFMTVFMFVLCIKPFVGKLLTRLTNKELKLLLISVCFFDCIQAVIGHNAFAEKGAGVLHACHMLILGYGMQHLKELKFKKTPFFALYLGACVIAGGLSFVGKIILKADDAVAVYYNSPLMVAASVGFFAYFADWQCTWKWPAKIAPHVLAVYLINDHPAVQESVYENVLHCSRFYASNLMIMHWLVCVIGFTVVGITIDLLATRTCDSLKKALRKGFHL